MSSPSLKAIFPLIFSNSGKLDEKKTFQIETKTFSLKALSHFLGCVCVLYVCIKPSIKNLKCRVSNRSQKTLIVFFLLHMLQKKKDLLQSYFPSAFNKFNLNICVLSKIPIFQSHLWIFLGRRTTPTNHSLDFVEKMRRNHFY